MIKRVTTVVMRALIIATCALGWGGPLYGESTPQPPTGEKAPQNISDVVQAYRDIVCIRQAMLEETEQRHRSGRSDATDVTRDKLRLAKARLQLAETLGGQGEVTRELQTILSIREEILETLTHRQASGQVTQHSLNEAKIAVLEVKIRLSNISQGQC